jgi:hypothetical protein
MEKESSMKRLLCFVLVGLAVAPCLRAESLGDAAKREEERRKKIEESGEGSSQVIHETELWMNKGRIANQGGSSSSFADTSNAPDSRASSPKASSSKSPAGNGGTGASASGELAWRQRADGARKEIASAQNAYDKVMKEQPPVKANRMWRDQDGNLQGGGFDMAALAAANKDLQARQEAAKQRLDNARAALDNLEEEARHAGIPAGWVR